MRKNLYTKGQIIRRIVILTLLILFILISNLFFELKECNWWKYFGYFIYSSVCIELLLASDWKNIIKIDL